MWCEEKEKQEKREEAKYDGATIKCELMWDLTTNVLLTGQQILKPGSDGIGA